MKTFTNSILKFGLLIALLCGSAPFALADEFRMDPARVQGPDVCADCHEYNVAAWRETHHFKTFKELPSRPKAREIADKMGLKRIKQGSDCLGCHFTAKPDDSGKVKTIAGITCESCHGAGDKYVDIHSDFGGKEVTAENEPAAHRDKRWADSSAAGMIRPVDTYKVAANCYSCHTVPNEKLVNVGGHPAGSKFELVRWSQGEVRHNLHYSNGKENVEAPVERRRMLYLVGKMLDLEYAFRGLADATAKADYAVSMAKRAQRATAQLKALNGTLNNSHIAQIVALGEATKLKLNARDAYTSAAKKVSDIAKKFAADTDPASLAAVDARLPTPDKYRGKVYNP
ncbi:MAG: hypothetical protein HKN50_04580 [Gammaproteobacteria bacterium]|nr:hypothetical protein [Gammaproteobacteria bacterium]